MNTVGINNLSTNLNCATLKMTRSLGIRGKFSISRVLHGGYTILLSRGVLIDVNKNLPKTNGGVRCSKSRRGSE